MREVKQSRYNIKEKEDLMIRRKFPFLLIITRLNGEMEIDGSKTRLHINIVMKLSTNLSF